MYTHRIAAIVLMGLALPGWAVAQEPPAEETPVHVFGTVGLGIRPPIADSPEILTLSAALTANLGKRDFVLRTMATGYPFGAFVWDVGLLYGHRRLPDHSRVRAAVGPAYTIYYTYRETSAALGLAGQVDVAWTPTRWFGLGLGLVANLNPMQSVWGVVVTTNLGSLW